MKMTNGMDLETDLGMMRIQIVHGKVEMFYLENNEIVEGGEFDLELFTKCIQEFYEFEF